MAVRRIVSHGHEHHAGEAASRPVLWLVLLLNITMFGLEIWQGVHAGSTSLLADSMDFLGDAFSYGMTLSVLHGSLCARARTSLVKAALMLVLAAGAIGQGVAILLHHRLPDYQAMGWIGSLALLVNATCASLLYASRGYDSNMRSIWLCSRNDVIANILVLLAAWLVYLTRTPWPDLLVACAIAALAVASALHIIRHARAELASGT